MSKATVPTHMHQPSLASPDYMNTQERFNRDHASFDKVKRDYERAHKSNTIDKKRRESLDRE